MYCRFGTARLSGIDLDAQHSGHAQAVVPVGKRAKPSRSYSAPEYHRGFDLGPEADVFSLGEQDLADLCSVDHVVLLT